MKGVKQNKNMKIVTVIPLKKGTWRENLTYFSAKNIPNGSIVTIPLRNKKVLGLVISSEDVALAKSNIKDMSFNLKKISEVKDHSIFLKEYFDSAIKTSQYFVSGQSNGITSLIPAVLRENYDKIASAQGGFAPGGKKENFKNIKSEKLLFQAPLPDRISVYRTLIRGSFALKKSVFMVLPTEYDIRTFEESLSKGIKQFTFAIHGELSSKKIIKKIGQIITLAHPVLILGTAPFLSIPRPDVGTIVAEHESSSVYKMIGKPHFDLRFFAELFATKINAKFILGDSLLRYESLARQEIDGLIPIHPLSFRINFQGQIEIKSLKRVPEALLMENSISKASGTAKFQILRDESMAEIKSALGRKKSVFIFSLRKGLATTTVCKDCGETVSCEKCESPLVLYLSHQGKKRMFVCNRCQKDMGGETLCAFCRSWNLMPLGIGTDTVYKYIEEILSKEADFPNKKKIKIFKLDKESAKTIQGAGKIIKEFEENPGSILIGTEMAFFYLQNKVPLSIIASFDSLWSIPSFKMSEKIIQIIFSIIGNTTEKLIIQTKNENDPAILAIKSENLLSFVREELEDRKNLNYPPFKRFIKITHLGDKEQTIKARKILGEIFKEYSPEIFSGFVARLKGKYITNALIKIDPKKWSLPEISAGSFIDENLFAKLLSLPPNFEVFVDPEDLL
jgi:primosomal protein N'